MCEDQIARQMATNNEKRINELAREHREHLIECRDFRQQVGKQLSDGRVQMQQNGDLAARAVDEIGKVSKIVSDLDARAEARAEKQRQDVRKVLVVVVGVLFSIVAFYVARDFHGLQLLLSSAP